MNAATLAVLLERFFTQRLMSQRHVSAHTISSYRDTFRLLFAFTRQRLHTPPSQLAREAIDAPLIGAFLDDLETRRGNAVRSRNLRLTAIRSFFHYAAYEAPTHAAQIQRVLAMPSKRYTRRLITFLTRPEIDALLAAPDQRTWGGRRDHAFVLLAVQTGLRVSEMTGLPRPDVSLGPGAHVRCVGKGRKERCTPSPSRPSPCCTPGYGSRPGCRRRRCFPTPVGVGSVRMACTTFWRSTPRSPATHARPWRTSASRRMSFATPRPWSCCKRESIPR